MEALIRLKWGVELSTSPAETFFSKLRLQIHLGWNRIHPLTFIKTRSREPDRRRWKRSRVSTPDSMSHVCTVRLHRASWCGNDGGIRCSELSRIPSMLLPSLARCRIQLNILAKQYNYHISVFSLRIHSLRTVKTPARSTLRKRLCRLMECNCPAGEKCHENN